MKFSTYMASVLLIGVYVLSYVGFSVHKCSCEGSVQISILIGNSSCEDLHTHIPLSRGEFHHCDEHHDDGCCSTEVLVLTSEQTNPDQQNLFVALLSGVVQHLNSHILELFEPCSYDFSGVLLEPLASLRHCRSFLAIWRL